MMYEWLLIITLLGQPHIIAHLNTQEECYDILQKLDVIAECKVSIP